MARPTQLPTRIYRGVVWLAFGIIAANLVYLQVVKQQHFKDQATDNVEVSQRVRAPRGNILDRDGIVLADNVFRSSIVLKRSCLKDGVPDSTLSRLMDWYGLDPEETVDRLAHQLDSDRPKLVLVADASMAQIALLEENLRVLPGAALDARPWRRYRHGALFAHVIGYTGEVTADEVAESRRQNADFPTFLSGFTRGREGVETIREDVLRGQDGSIILAVDANGIEVGREPRVTRTARQGQDVRLTLSAPLQEALSDAMAGRPGCAVALALPSGDVLAAVSLPTYDTNLFTRGISSEDWQSLLGDGDHPLLNRIVQATYPPGSPYKIVTSLSALENGAAVRSSRFDPCLGGYQFGNRVFHCWNRNGHGNLNHGEALVHSCDVFYYQVVQLLTLEQIRKTALALGLGARTGVPFHGEAAGIVPDGAWYDDRFGPRRWTRGVLLNNAIGQGELLVTPIQMAVLTGRIALGDANFSPHFILDDQRIRATPAPLPFREANLDWVRKTMHQVVDIGTGVKARLEAVDVAGKTGTSQNPHGEDHAWFVCFAPAKDPQVAFVVILEQGGSGGAEAAPVAARWLIDYFESVGTRMGES